MKSMADGEKSHNCLEGDRFPSADMYLSLQSIYRFGLEGAEMKQYGICYKCGKYTAVRGHHINGYFGENKDKVVPYCQSCDFKAHIKARKEGKCKLSFEETNRLSTMSYNRRVKKLISLSCKTIAPNIRLHENLMLNTNTGTLTINSYFQGTNFKKLKYIEVE